MDLEKQQEPLFSIFNRFKQVEVCRGILGDQVSMGRAQIAQPWSV